jgi:pyruvate/2-oxoglutarate dehydrogenase complex dihydrolipoamide dehydrogenase (E3) component
MAKYDFDVIVIGGGAGGMSAAKTANGIGKKTLIVEKNKMGGDCTWFGCIPSKALIWAAKQLYQAKKLDAFSVRTKTPVETDSSGVMQYVKNVIQHVYEGSNAKVFENQGITVETGNPGFSDAHTVDIDGSLVTADRFIIATGSSPFVPLSRE